LLGALAVPGLLLISCNDSNETPAAPTPSDISKPTPARGGHLDPAKVRLPQASAQELAAAVREDEGDQALMAPADPAMAATSSSDLAPHDPTPVGMRVQCIDGDEGTGIPTFNGEAYRFKNNKGCELNTNDGDADPNNNAAFVVTTQNKIRGKKLTQIQRLDFYYAGGPPVGGSPRFSIPIDEAPTDGTTEGYAFVDVLGCNDGDAYVGALRGDDDGTCTVSYGANTYPNFSAFEAAYPDARIATDAVTFIALDQPGHYLIYRVNIR
jgi:hypothetical protein